MAFHVISKQFLIYSYSLRATWALTFNKRGVGDVMVQELPPLHHHEGEPPVVLLPRVGEVPAHLTGCGQRPACHTAAGCVST